MSKHDRPISQAPRLLAQLIDLVNCLPKPFTFPPDFKPWLKKEDEEETSGERSARIDKELEEWNQAIARSDRPLEARLIHPEVIRAESHYGLDLEEVLPKDQGF